MTIRDLVKLLISIDTSIVIYDGVKYRRLRATEVSVSQGILTIDIVNQIASVKVLEEKVKSCQSLIVKLRSNIDSRHLEIENLEACIGRMNNDAHELRKENERLQRQISHFGDLEKRVAVLEGGK